MMVSDPDRVEGGLDLAPPVVEEIAKHREFRCDVIVLVDEQLNQRRMIGHVIADLDRAQAIALKLPQEIRIRAACLLDRPGIYNEAITAHLLLLR